MRCLTNSWAFMVATTVRNALVSLFADSGLYVHTEVPAPLCALRPADVLIDGLDFDPAALDVAEVHGL